MMEEEQILNRFSKGLRDGLPIGLGYLSVSFTFGMMAVNSGLPVWVAVLISMTCLTSAGQFAGLSLILTGGSLVEMALTQIVINLRYALMSLSLSQKLDASVGKLSRLLIAFGNTDEIFAVAMGQKQDVGKRYFYGLMCAPYFMWAGGTLLGCVASGLLPESVRSALGIAIYGMFIAIILPVAKHFRPVVAIVLLSAVLSCLFRYIPGLNQVSGGFVIIVCAVVAAAVGAVVAPVDGGGRD